MCRIIEFATYSDMKNALDKLDNTEINGRRIKLVEDRPKRRRCVDISFVQNVHAEHGANVRDGGWGGCCVHSTCPFY